MDKFNTIAILTTELKASYDFTNELLNLFKLIGMGKDIVWCNGGNCRLMCLDALVELHRSAKVLAELDSELGIKKGPPPQHRIYWDDCPEVPADLSQLLKE